MKEIELLEAAVGKEIAQWNAEDLEKFSLEENLELVQLFKNPDVVSEVLNLTTNKDVADVLVPLRIKTLVDRAENYGNELLSSLENKAKTEEEILAKVEHLLDGDSYQVLVSALILVSMFQDYDLQKHEIKIRESIEMVKELIISLIYTSIDSTFSLINDLMELIFPLRSKYFQKYEVDILNDEDKKFKVALDDLNAFELKMIDELQHLTEEIKNELEATNKNE